MIQKKSGHIKKYIQKKLRRQITFFIATVCDDLRVSILPRITCHIRTENEYVSRSSGQKEITGE